MFIPIPIPAALFGLIYLVYSTYMARRGADNIAHDVHVWGALYGIAFIAVVDFQIIVKFFNYFF